MANSVGTGNGTGAITVGAGEGAGVLVAARSVCGGPHALNAKLAKRMQLRCFIMASGTSLAAGWQVPTQPQYIAVADRALETGLDGSAAADGASKPGRFLL